MTIFFIFLISLCPEIVNLNFTFELRSLIFAIFATILLGFWSLGGNCHKRANSLRQFIFQDKNKLRLIDVAFIAVTILTVISFVTKTESIYAFHYVFVQVGMAIVYFFIRTTLVPIVKRIGKSTKDTKKIRTDNCIVNFIKEQRTKNQVLISIVGIGLIVAVIGLVQFVLGKPVVSTFGRTSYLGCFLAMNVPFAFGLVLATSESKGLSKVKGQKVEGQKLFALPAAFAFLVILGVVILTKSRTAMIAMAVVLPIMIFATKARRLKEKKKSVEKKELKTKLYKRKSVKLLLCLGVLVALFLVFNIGKVVYKIRPMSASGRVLIWKVSAEMLKENPISGVGFGNFANYYNLYQAEYFVSGKGSVVNKMTAGQIRHSYNWYLETAVEFGIFGLIVFGMFWWLILKEIYKTFFLAKARRREGKNETDYRTPNTEYFLNMGMAGAVLCFMIMSLFQFPWQIIPTYLLFNVALAWIVNANEYTDLHISFLTTNEHE